MKLSELKTGEKGIIVKVSGRKSFCKRISEMGFVKGQTVEVILNAPLKDPVEYKIMGYEVSLRKSEADLIEIITENDASIVDTSRNQPLTIKENYLKKVAIEKSKIINVALVGNPNCGKTSLFNFVSGAHARVGNYTGVTVDAKEGHFKHKGYTFKIADLPGTYSLSPYSPEELYVRDYIHDKHPDIIVNVIDSSNIQRNLYLTTQLIDMDVSGVIALNMYDEFQEKGSTLNTKLLSELIGYPIIPTVSKTGQGLRELFDEVIEVYERRSRVNRHIHINYGSVLEPEVEKMDAFLHEGENIGREESCRYLGIKLLERDKEIENRIGRLRNSEEILKFRDARVRKIKGEISENIETSFTDARYGYIEGALKETLHEGNKDTLKKTHSIDNIVTHKIWGYPIFILFMFIMFEATFAIGQYPMDWISSCIDSLSGFIGRNMSDGPLKDLLTQGIIGGVGSVIVFLPNILILYFFISVMEDTGYMARAAFIMDKFMHKMGLHGKSFIPLVIGFGCNVPAIMATRTIESHKTRLLTMLVNPLMSCSARLTIYLLFIGTFFGKKGGLILFLLYFSGIFLAVIMCRIFKKFLVKGEDLPFVMELPPYRIPTGKSILLHMWEKASQYLKKMGGIILIASIIIWFLEYFPLNREMNKAYESKIAKVEVRYANKNVSEKNHIIESIQKQQRYTHQENSYIGRFGKFIQPVFNPLGFNWKMCVSLISGMAAKEIVVSTMGILYTGDSDDNSALIQRLSAEKWPDGTPVYTPLVVLSFLFFVLIYFPCIATVAAIKNESGSWRWAVFVIFYTTALAWLVSFSIFQIGRLLI